MRSSRTLARAVGRWLPLALTAAGLAGCASSERRELPEQTSVLVEVVRVLTRQEILTGQVRIPRTDGKSDPVAIPMYLQLLAGGMQSGDMVDGSVIVGRTQYFWQEPEVGRSRETIWGETIRVLLVARGLEVNPGNVVQAERVRRFVTVTRVKYKSLADGKCFYGTDDGTVSGLTRAALRPSGRNGAASLRCAGLAQEGWSAVQRCNGIEWTKPAPAGRAREAFYGESKAHDQLKGMGLDLFVRCRSLAP